MNEVKALLTGLISFLVVQGFKLLGDWLKKDLKGTAAFVSFVVVAGVLAAFDAVVFKVPPEYRDLVEFVAKWIVVLFGGSGAFRIYANLKKK